MSNTMSTHSPPLVASSGPTRPVYPLLDATFRSGQCAGWGQTAWRRGRFQSGGFRRGLVSKGLGRGVRKKDLVGYAALQSNPCEEPDQR
jgi:hypothetical protein